MYELETYQNFYIHTVYKLQSMHGKDKCNSILKRRFEIKNMQKQQNSS